MSAERDIERVLETWFTDGVNQMPDRVYSSVIDRVDRQPQRPGWRLLPWRSSAVNTPLKLVLIGAALVLALAAGSILIAGGNRGIGVAPAPTATPTAAPTPTPAPTPSVSSTPKPMPDGLLLPGAYVSHPFSDDTLTWTVTVPAGWAGANGWVLIDKPKDRGIVVGPDKVLGIPKDSCTPVPATPVKSVDALVAAVQARTDWTVSDPVDATIGGYSGRRIDIEVPAEVTCPGGRDYTVLVDQPDGTGFYAQGPSNRFSLWILDVEGSPLTVMRNSFATSDATAMSQSDDMIASSVITP